MTNDLKKKLDRLGELVRKANADGRIAAMRGRELTPMERFHQDNKREQSIQSNYAECWRHY